MKISEETGDSDFSAAFREHEPRLVRFLASRVGCRATAEDLAQDVFLKARQGTRWAAVASPQAFLFRIALNLLSNYKAQIRRRAEITAQVKHLLSYGLDEVTPERNVIAADELASVAAVLRGLPEKTRTIVYWSRFDGLTKAEIAARLGITYQAVEGHMERALTRLIQAGEMRKEK